MSKDRVRACGKGRRIRPIADGGIRAVSGRHAARRVRHGDAPGRERRPDDRPRLGFFGLFLLILVLGMTSLPWQRTGAAFAGAQSFRLDAAPLPPDGLVERSVTEGDVQGLFVAPKGRTGLPAVLLLGGSSPNPELSNRYARALAAEGYAVFAQRYFGASGLPEHLLEVPLEIMTHGLDWLVRQEEVDPARIAVWGRSKGSEAALLLGLHDPRIKAVIAVSPSSVVWQGLAKFRHPHSSWTWQNKSLPFLRYRWSPFSSIFDYYDDALDRVDRHPEAVIPVERIAAPILLLAGEDDRLWPSARMVRMIAARLESHGRHDRLVMHIYPQAGHGLPPPVVSIDPKKLRVFGGTQEGNAAARKAAWRELRCFLQHTLREQGGQEEANAIGPGSGGK